MHRTKPDVIVSFLICILHVLDGLDLNIMYFLMSKTRRVECISIYYSARCLDIIPRDILSLDILKYNQFCNPIIYLFKFYLFKKKKNRDGELNYATAWIKPM